MSLGFTDNTFQSQNNFFGSLGFLVENLFGLTTITGLFSVISSFTLSEQRSFTSFVLGNFVLGMFTAFFTFTVGLSSFWNVNYNKRRLLVFLWSQEMVPNSWLFLSTIWCFNISPYKTPSLIILTCFLNCHKKPG